MVIIYCEQKTKQTPKDKTILIISELTSTNTVSGYCNAKFPESKTIDLIHLNLFNLLASTISICISEHNKICVYMVI